LIQVTSRGGILHALVIYDSVFGNTEQIAKAIAEGLSSGAVVELARVTDISIDRLGEFDMVVVGSPTRGFRPTEALAAVLKSLPSKALKGHMAAAFDTRFKADEIESGGLRFIVKTGGYAAKRISSQLVKAGATLVIPPEGFYVQDTEGPLKPGELERAGDWARQVLATL